MTINGNIDDIYDVDCLVKHFYFIRAVLYIYQWWNTSLFKRSTMNKTQFHSKIYDFL